jgi:hypothetical protein
MDEQKLKEMIVAMGTMQEWISAVLDGHEPSDFALSYPLVRRVWELQKFWSDGHKEGGDAKCPGNVTLFLYLSKPRRDAAFRVNKSRIRRRT